jgi:OmpA-OmpF porin, OOP family
MKIHWLVLTLSLALALPAAAQTPGKVLSGPDLTQESLIEALTPAPDAAVDGELATRGSASSPTEPAVAPKPASASVLITFHTNSASLTPNAMQILEVVAAALASDKLANFRFSIEGHADPRGNAKANRVLSQVRAESVREYLVHSKHIAAERLEAIGKGDQEPMNTTNPAAPENRRVTIVNLAQVAQAQP